MSWMKRPQAAVPSPGPEPQPYGTSQFANQQNMYPNYQGGAPGNPQQQQQYWQMPQQQQQHQYNQQYGQVYQQQDYGNNANQFYQQPIQYNQNFSNQGYTNPQQLYQQNYYPNQGAQQQTKVNVKSDGWEDNWDWGWEDSSKQAQNAAVQNITLPSLTSQPQPQMFNNANVIEESFASTDSWNWAMEDKKETKEQIALAATSAPSKHESKEPIMSSSMLENITRNESSVQKSSNNLPAQPTKEVRTLSDREAVKERLPNLALGKRFNLDNLTPQWSIESQMSQESSDGLQTHSESTYRSENQSRNSNKSSPGPNTDNSNFNYSQSGLDDLYPHNSEWSRHSTDEVTLADNLQNNSSRCESHDELSSSLQEMSIANCENPTPDSLQARKELESKNAQEVALPLQPPLSQSPVFPPPASSSLPPPPSLSSGSMPPPPPVTSTILPSPPPSSVTLPPPSNFTTSTSQNPFKHAGPFSHKSKGSGSSNQAFPPQMSSTNLTSPTVVNKISQHRIPGGFSANLETTPDNSERPDQPQVSAFRSPPVTQQMPDNLEVAPKKDRNEYLQTAHLSSGDYGENTDFSRNIPPPGLRRMVVGQQESEYNQNLNMSGDEPPPGLARMVPGQHTEADNTYNQQSDNYLDRHIDGQLTTGSMRPYRQADGQQTPDNYTQPPSTRGNERRPIGLDRMVPGEPGNEYSQYQGSSFGNSNEQRVVTGVDHDYSVQTEAGPSDIREQNVDGSDYSDHRNTQRNIIGAQEISVDPSPEFSAAPEEQQREIIMEGENLQDLSIISSTELTFSREQTLEGADVNVNDAGTDRKTDASDSIDHPTSNSRRQSLNRVNTSGDDSERDRTYKSSPRRDRDKNKSSRDRDRDRDGRYSRDDRKYDRESDRRSGRDDRRTEKDRRDRVRDRDRRDRDESPDIRRHRRSTRSRYETEDTDYYSDRERDRRRYRESSSKPPRPDDKDRRYDERDRRSTRRYNTIERDRRYDDERNGGSRRDRHRDRDRDRYEMRYRDIDPTRKHGNLRREQEDRRRGESYSSPSRPDSREAARTDDDLAEGGETRRAGHARRSHRRHHADPYYGYSGGYADPYLAQQQYQYYEQLRRSDPAAYNALYKRLMAGQPPPSQEYIASAKLTAPLYGDSYGPLGYDGRAEGRGSVHSGRSSANGLKGTDTYYGSYRHDAGSLRDAPSLRTDLSDRYPPSPAPYHHDRDLNTDASLNLHLEDSTVRSERMTPFKFSTAHIKGSISSRHIVLVRPSYPVDGLPATVHVYSLAAALATDPLAVELAQYPGPLVKGVTHKKSVMEYCESRVRGAARAAGGDRVGYVLLWELLALLLRQNGVVVGTDIAELLMKNKREYEIKTSKPNESRRGSSVSAEGRDEELRNSSPDQLSTTASDLTPQEELSSSRPAVDEKAALDRLREYLTFGNRHEALEWAMSSGLWGHALTLAAHGERRVRAAVAARFLASLPRADPLHTLFAALAGRQPPAATCVSDERWGDWRPHCAMLLANSSGRAEQDRRTLTQMGDTLAARGLLYCAQFCYVAAGVPFQRHSLAPLAATTAATPAPAPRLPLLLADPRADSLHALATNQAIFATEIYEYALSLNQDYVITELQVYKLVLACRLVDVGQYERALAYAEQAARAVTRAPGDYSPALIHQLAELADRLKYHDPALQEEPSLMDEATGGDSGEPSPRHHQQWLDDVKSVAQSLTAAALSQQSTPQHYVGHDQQQQPTYGWHEQYQQTSQTYADPVPAEETADYTAQYYAQQQHEQQQPEQQPYSATYGEQWPGAAQSEPRAPPAHSYADPYWQPDSPYGHAEGGGGAVVGAAGSAAGGAAGGAADEEPRPMITMPGSAARSPHYDDFDDDRPPSAEQTDRETDTPKSNKQQSKLKEEGKSKHGSGSGGGWFGGILNKLSLRAPNQMILPDDRNPSIVWDAEHKRWRNLDGDEDAPAAPPPPPTAAQLAAHHHQTAPASPLQPPAVAPPTAPLSNIFKMQKGRHIRKSYVDVFNPSSTPTRPLPPPADVLGPAAPAVASTPSYFVPQQSGVYEPSQPADHDDNYNSGI